MTNRNLALLHPKFSGVAQRLHEELIRAYKAGRTHFCFEVFETYRPPDVQAGYLAKGTTKAGPWQSAHQFGLAVDFVPYIGPNDIQRATELFKKPIAGGWIWPPLDFNDWRVLHDLAHATGCRTIEWDAPHLESPLFDRVKNVLG